MSTSFFKENKHEINKDENNYNINKNNKLQLIKVIDIEKEKINNYINESKKHIRNY